MHTGFTFLMRRLALVLLLAGLSGCDSQTNGESPIVGTWTEASSIEQVFVTTDRTQAAVDPSRPGEGELTVSGAENETFRYAGAFVSYSSELQFTVFSVNHLAQPFPTSYGFLGLNSLSISATIWRNGSYRQFSHSHPPPPLEYSWDGTRLTLPAITLTAGDGATVVASGTLLPATRQIVAGEETEVQTRTMAWLPGSSRTTYAFHADGTYQRTHLGHNGDTHVEEGRWEEIGGERLRLTSLAGAWETPYRVEAGRLMLTTNERPCTSNPTECFAVHEREYALVEGSVTQVRTSHTVVFER